MAPLPMRTLILAVTAAIIDRMRALAISPIPVADAARLAADHAAVHALCRLIRQPKASEMTTAGMLWLLTDNSALEPAHATEDAFDACICRGDRSATCERAEDRSWCGGVMRSNDFDGA